MLDVRHAARDGPPRRVRGDVHRHFAAAGVGVPQGDDVGMAGGVPGEQDRRFVGLCAGRREEALAERAGRQFRHLLGQSGLRLVDVKRGRMLQCLVLVDDRPVHGFVAMPDAHREDAAEEVEVLSAGGVGEIHAPAADHREGVLVVGADAGEQVLLLQALRPVLVGLFACHP